MSLLWRNMRADDAKNIACIKNAIKSIKSCIDYDNTLR